MVKCGYVAELMNTLAPEKYAEAWDNVGLIIGSRDSEAAHILISLDFTEETLEEAVKRECQMVITHHPPIFGSINKVNGDTPVGRLVLDAARSGISVYSAHTNLDYAKGGTNDALFEILRLENKEGLMPPNEYGESLGRIGTFNEAKPLWEVCSMIRSVFRLDAIKFSGDPESYVKKVACMAGSGASMVYFNEAVKKGADLFVTGDVKYHEALSALAMGLSVIDATHFATEFIICRKIKKFLMKEFGAHSDVEVLITNSQTGAFKYL